MINKDSVVTAYDEHLTLVEWLQKVSKALNESVLTNLGIAKLSDHDNIATYQVTATFADNTTIVSDTFTLPSTDIVTAFNDLTALVNGFDDRITDNTNDVASIINIIDIGNDKIKASTLQNSINGSDDVIVDVDATSDKLEIHLLPELQAKLARVLLLPLSAPSTRKVVTIDNNGAQDNVDSTSLSSLMSNIVDSHGNKRFVEGSVTVTSNDFTPIYAKWSLSGTHLMIVLCASFESGARFNGARAVAYIDNIPSYILNKIRPLLAKRDFVINADVQYILTSGLIQTFNATMLKSGSVLSLYFMDNVTMSDSGSLRVQFDLLIDSE